MSAAKRLRTRTFGSQPELIRMRDLEPEDASWVSDPLAAWNAIESKARAALMHRNIEFDSGHVSGYQLAEFLDDTFDTSWRRAPVYEHAIRVNRLEALRHQIDRGRWVVLGWWKRQLVEWIEDPGVPEGGRWQLRPRWRSVENGSALERHLNEVSRRRWRETVRTSTPLSDEPFRAQFDAGSRVSTPLGDAQPFELGESSVGGDVMDIAARGVGEAQEAECYAEYEARLESCKLYAAMSSDPYTYVSCKANAFRLYNQCRGY
ncbi:hypothetical protein [Trinickia terrae]|uniref:hypothetical protein n=1 Tax=Trinickia terrae TaxID=2571161 RepID=UPI001F0F7018|nr:hypothetical protein [Trinickia terrae]